MAIAAGETGFVVKIDKSVMVVRSGKPVETTVGSEVVLMTLDTGECLGLGETGSAVWRLLEQPVRVGAVVEQLSEEYEAPAGVIEQDVVELLEEMQGRGLVEVVEELVAGSR